MKNKNLIYAILCILFILLNVVVFAIPTDKTGTFWVAYVFTVVAFALQVPVWEKSLKQKDTLKRKFLGISTVHVGIVGLILQVIALAVFIAVPTLPSWAAVVVCAIIFGLSTICLVSSGIGVREISRVEEKVLEKTFFIKELQANVELIAEAETDNETKTMLKQLAEKIRYSDPVSNEKLADLESRISAKAEGLKTADNIIESISELNMLLDERNKKCKILK